MTRYVTPLTATERYGMARAARGWVGVRWRHQGRSRAGVDCGGLLVMAMRDIGRDMLDKRAYGRVPKDGWLEAAMIANFGAPQGADALGVGSVVVMHFGAGQADHVGIIGAHPDGGWRLIHAYAPWRKVVEHRLDDVWRDRITEVYQP